MEKRPDNPESLDKSVVFSYDGISLDIREKAVKGKVACAGFPACPASERDCHWLKAFPVWMAGEVHPGADPVSVC